MIKKNQEICQENLHGKLTIALSMSHCVLLPFLCVLSSLVDWLLFLSSFFPLYVHSIIKGIWERKGKCKNGDKCPNSHDLKSVKRCQLHIDGKCKKGNECKFRHKTIAGERFDEKLCPHFILDGVCYKNCKYRPHYPKEVCENYLYGFCPNGPNCKKVQ